MVTHGGFDNSDINKDVNAMFPIDRLHELVAEGFIGSLADETYTFMGGGGNAEKFTNETGPEIARKLKAQGVDIVLCTGGCGTCHRSATIVTRCCEEAGMSCVVIAALPPIARQQGAPRITAPHVPIGAICATADVAKAVGVLACYGGSIVDYEGGGKVPGDIVPLIAIPTTAGTGSEVTVFSVITDHSRNYKLTVFSYKLLPAYAILDVDLITTVPAGGGRRLRH